ncbi:MAG: hypothetical protein RLZZ73_511, partial [Actinomycetota bacterium]
RLSEDHRRAKAIAQAVGNTALVDPQLVDTNIIGIDLSSLPLSAADLATRCKEKGLWISALGPKYARLVTHLDFDDAQLGDAIEILKSALVVK